MDQEELQSRVFSLFGRGNQEAINYFLNCCPLWVRELCDYPYWFLVIKPKNMGAVFPVTAGISTLPAIVGSWIQSGWLKTTAGVDTYPIYAPYSDNQASQAIHFTPAKVRSVNFVKEFNKEGGFTLDLPVLDQNQSLSFSDYRVRSRPCQVILETNEDGSFLQFSPCPDEVRLYAVQFSLYDCPWYQKDTGEILNRWLNYAPQALVYKAAMHMAEYHKDTAIFKEYQEMLYGNPPKGDNRSSTMIVGELGRLKKETQQKNFQMYQSVSPMRGAGSFGRGGGPIDDPFYQQRAARRRR